MSQRCVAEMFRWGRPAPDLCGVGKSPRRRAREPPREIAEGVRSEDRTRLGVGLLSLPEDTLSASDQTRRTAFDEAPGCDDSLVPPAPHLRRVRTGGASSDRGPSTIGAAMVGLGGVKPARLPTNPR
jgi:hypothetical protein